MSDPTPRALGYRLPAEWEPHAATWLSWPHNENSWPGKFGPVPAIWQAFAQTLVDHGEPVHILAGQGSVWDEARRLTAGLPLITLHEKATNDAWIRDHGPMFLTGSGLPPALVDWDYNAWGGKYPPFDDDNAVPAYIAAQQGRQRYVPGMILEGGSIEPNGAGTLLVTAQCLLNPNRNPTLSQAEIEARLSDFAAIDQVLWLGAYGDGSIAGDDTDAHIDQLARFVSEDTVLAVVAADDDDEDADLLRRNFEALTAFRLPDGRALNVVPLPLPPPRFYDDSRLPASYANFYIANGVVIVPGFDAASDDRARGILADHFPGRSIVVIPALDLVWGLGAFHCASMHEPI